MSAHYTDDEEGKRVVTADGDEIGMVSEVRDGRLHVDPDPGMTDSIKASLGWGDADEDTYALDDDKVESVTDDEIHIGRM
ncbi:PRC-barrel domain containing protein [Halovivax gelatinilyticus]|uniref:PRC-barrel domain containing protein n=1 Tax=Halovivax gelatinilyticus TaxID=2961597 RepID=UPI0020CA69BC|nr:PRC-barrel domain containing protein [Halovivax gelatinilyticus]